MCGLYAGCETSPPNYTHAIRTQRLVKEKNKMSDIQGGDLFANETLFPHSQCWLKYYILKNQLYLPRFLEYYNLLLFLLEKNINKEM